MAYIQKHGTQWSDLRMQVNILTLTLLTWRIWWAPTNASKWQMGFNSAFKGLRQKHCVLTENWACFTWMHWPSLSGQHHILSSQLCTRSSSLLTAELSVRWLPTQCSALGPVRLVCFTTGRKCVMVLWLNKWLSETAKSLPKSKTLQLVYCSNWYETTCL